MEVSIYLEFGGPHITQILPKKNYSSVINVQFIGGSLIETSNFYFSFKIFLSLRLGRSVFDPSAWDIVLLIENMMYF